MPEQNAVDPRLKASLMTIVNLMRGKAETKGLKPVIRTQRLLDLLNMYGTNVSLEQLEQAAADPSISSLIKDINKDEVSFRTKDDEESPLPDFGDEENPEEIPGMEDPNSQMDNDEIPPIQNQNDNGESTSVKHNGSSIISTMAGRALKRL